MLKTFLAALVPAALMVAPAIAASEHSAPDGTISVTVDFGDLDLQRADHQAVLAERLERAAQDACGQPFTRTLRGRAYEVCVDDALSAARAELAKQGLSGAVLAAR